MSKGQKRKHFEISVDVSDKDVQATDIYEILKHAGIGIASIKLIREVE